LADGVLSPHPPFTLKIVTTEGKLTRPPVRERGGSRVFGTIAVVTSYALKEPVTEFVDLLLPAGDEADRFLQYCTTGDTLLVSGREHLKSFPRKNGSNGFVNEIFVTSFRRTERARRPRQNP
jgi:hypothetical protein